ncbi:hypothetical protein ATANTOWER_019862 [Ataeniobius toweri]|uniref:Uncharacterized protein n=1 Tax=Ataeniobius toweri TaxID=208326 RepID=A0ABU7CLK5_9TELE|nr:hypothetical protein [Ataeniobius toweri]
MNPSPFCGFQECSGKDDGPTISSKTYTSNQKLTGRARTILISKAAKRPMLLLEELQRSIAQMHDSVYRKTISHTVQKIWHFRVSGRMSFHGDRTLNKKIQKHLV